MMSTVITVNKDTGDSGETPPPDLPQPKQYFALHCGCVTKLYKSRCVALVFRLVVL